MKGKLVIIGCSWGCGEFTNQGKELVINHAGLSEYLASKYSVTNLSRPGASNWQSCFSFKNYFAHRVDPDQQATCLVMQTDPFRSVASDKFDVDIDSLLSNSNSLREFYQQTLEIFYIKLNNMAEYYQTKIYMIGGLSDLDLDVLKLYPNLESLCPSWIHLMDPAHSPSPIPLILNPKLLETAKKYSKINIMDEVISASDENFLRAQKLMETDFFGPVFGDFHPSRKGHRVLADYILNYFEKGTK